MTVRELREAISNLPDDGEVYVQRIEDFYFEDNGWPVKKVEGEHYHRMVRYRDDVASGKYPDHGEEVNLYIISTINQELEACKEQYIDTHCCIDYDGKNLYITSHY